MGELTCFWSPGVMAWWPTRRGACSETFASYLEATEPRMPLAPPGLMAHVRGGDPVTNP